MARKHSNKITKKRQNKSKKIQFGGKIKDVKFISIVLDDRDSKYDYFKTQQKKLKSMDIDLKKISGIDLRNFDTRILTLIPNLNAFIKNNEGEFGNNYYTKYQDEIIDRNNLGSLGCALSHIYVYKNIINNNIPYSVILEEDAIIYDEFDKKLQKVLNNLPENWDIVFLGMSCNYSHDDRCKDNDDMKCIGNNIYTIKYIYGTYGYLINLKGAKKIMNNIYPIWWHLDTLISNLNVQKILNIYTVIPNIVFHPGNFSISSKNYHMHNDYTSYDSAIQSNDINITKW